MLHNVRVIILSLLLFVLLALQPAFAAIDKSKLQKTFSPMDQNKMEQIIRAVSQNFIGGGSNMEFEYDGVRMACISDTRYNRMRIISPVAKESDLTSDILKILLESNFHLALDARYATSNGVLYAAFIHPLSSLHTEELESAIRQVSQLVKTYGSTYSSGELTFGGGEQRKRNTRPPEH